jgi:hypothetical protein
MFHDSCNLHDKAAAAENIRGVTNKVETFYVTVCYKTYIYHGQHTCHGLYSNVPEIICFMFNCDNALGMAVKLFSTSSTSMHSTYIRTSVTLWTRFFQTRDFDYVPWNQLYCLAMYIILKKQYCYNLVRWSFILPALISKNVICYSRSTVSLQKVRLQSVQPFMPLLHKATENRLWACDKIIAYLKLLGMLL